MSVRAVLLIAPLWACHPATPPAPPAAPSPITAAPEPHPSTTVVQLAPDGALAVLDGPFLVTSINPGSDLVMAIAPSHECPDQLAWFTYSGGGVAVAKGQTLCVRNVARQPKTHGFSGHD